MSGCGGSWLWLAVVSTLTVLCLCPAVGGSGWSAEAWHQKLEYRTSVLYKDHSTTHNTMPHCITAEPTIPYYKEFDVLLWGLKECVKPFTNSAFAALGRTHDSQIKAMQKLKPHRPVLLLSLLHVSRCDHSMALCTFVFFFCVALTVSSLCPSFQASWCPPLESSVSLSVRICQCRSLRFSPFARRGQHCPRL